MRYQLDNVSYLSYVYILSIIHCALSLFILTITNLFSCIHTNTTLLIDFFRLLGMYNYISSLFLRYNLVLFLKAIILCSHGGKLFVFPTIETPLSSVWFCFLEQQIQRLWAEDDELAIFRGSFNFLFNWFDGLSGIYYSLDWLIGTHLNLGLDKAFIPKRLRWCLVWTSIEMSFRLKFRFRCIAWTLILLESWLMFCVLLNYMGNIVGAKVILKDMITQLYCKRFRSKLKSIKASRE